MQFETPTKVRLALRQVFSLLDARFDLPVAELEFRLACSEAWTILEHLEHVCLCNQFLLLTITKGCAKARRRASEGQLPEGESDLALLSTIALPGAFDWPPPSHMIPTGTRTPAELRTQLNYQRDQCMELLAGMPSGEGRLCSIWMSVHALGRLDMYQWLYFLAQHAKYHLALIDARRGHEVSRES